MKHQPICAAVVAAVILFVRPASAQGLFNQTGANPTSARPTEDSGSTFELSYLWDGGAIPFFWAPLFGRMALDHYLTPDATPRMFDPGEGGAPRSSWEVPGAAVTGLGVGLGIAMIAGGEESRFFHAKGVAQSLMTGALLTGALKITFSRHRPDWSPEFDSAGQRMSFTSGHTTQAFAVATYAGLYLRQHVFAKYRGDRFMPWYEGLTYAGLAVGASALGAERILHNRHHLSDVLTGAALGTATSALFYWFQESRFQKHQAKHQRIRDFAITPSVTAEGATVGMSFSF